MLEMDTKRKSVFNDTVVSKGRLTIKQNKHVHRASREAPQIFYCIPCDATPNGAAEPESAKRAPPTLNEKNYIQLYIFN